MDQVRDLTAIGLPALLALFMIANLGAIGLELDLRAALAPMRNLRFVALVMLWDWVLCPGFAWLLARVVPMAEPYGLGLVLIGMAPAAPFLPLMVRRAGGDMAYAAGFMLIAAVGTVIFMPLALPVLAPGLAVDTWTIARPLIALLLAPLAAGLALRTFLPAAAGRLSSVVRIIGSLATLALLAAVLLLFYDGFIGAIGSYAIGTQLLYAAGTTALAWALGAGLPPDQRSVLSLGVGTRNLGAAIAPVLAVSSDPRTTVMLALGVPITLIVTFFAARWFGTRHEHRHSAVVRRPR